ncbi:uncharacterized protein [Lolium perenne]|uniref:uncharacterized protein n=1 Tax=Lolium perenne TaxID=4522 RepID=UPI0021EA31F7|nr:uncharacterized protein LOC127304879 [Lolium perenne]
MVTGQNRAASFFNFLKEGFLLPIRNPRLFTSVCVLIAASTTLITLGNDLAIHSIPSSRRSSSTSRRSINTTEYSSPDYAKLLQEIQNNTKELLLVGDGYVLFAVVVRAAVRIVVLFAAVSTYSSDDEQRATTFGALLGQAKAQIKGPLLTLAIVSVLEKVYAVILMAMIALVHILVVKRYFVTLLVASLLIIAASVYLVYFSFLCSFSVVVAVAESGCKGLAALAKAWRLANGKKWQVVLYLAVTGALSVAVSLVHMLARTFAGYSVALGLLLGFVYVALLGLVHLFSVCAITAFYYERRENIHSQLGATGYAKLSTEEANG